MNKYWLSGIIFLAYGLAVVTPTY
ncbi:DUF2574 family protein [Escherichia coli]|nr:DUF2574 family protein [Escherichia coli]